MSTNQGASSVVLQCQQHATDQKILGETYGFWCQTLVLLLAAILAFFAIRISRSTERRRAAAEAIFSSRHDDRLTSAITLIGTLHTDGEKNMASYAKKDHLTSEPSKAIRYALNHYEYVSVGISQGIYDEEIFKRSSFHTITRLYERTKPYIEQIRRDQEAPTTWQEVECLACRWAENRLERKRIMSIPAQVWWKRFFGL